MHLEDRQGELIPALQGFFLLCVSLVVQVLFLLDESTQDMVKMIF